MSDKIMKFFLKKSIKIQDIKYLTREDSKTCIHMINGDIVTTYIPAKDFFDVLAPFNFLSINKGVIVSKDQINYIANSDYYMVDGRVFSGRKRTVAKHKELNRTLHSKPNADISATDIRERFSVLDEMPIAFCVIELIFNSDGSGIDFIFRYCNKEMENLEKKTLEEMLDHSFFQVFPNADKKWLVAYTDVALTGNHRNIHDYSPEIDQELFISCFQPLEGFCACLLSPAEIMSNATPASSIIETHS